MLIKLLETILVNISIAESTEVIVLHITCYIKTLKNLNIQRTLTIH